MSTWTAVIDPRWLGKHLRIPAGLVWFVLALVALTPFLLGVRRLPAHPALAVIAIATVLSLVAAIMLKPYWGALALVVVVWVNASDVLNLTYNFGWLLRLLLALVIAAWLLHRLLTLDTLPLRMPFAEALGVYGVVLVIGTIFADKKEFPITNCVEYAKAIVIFLLVVNLLRTPKRLRAGILALLGAVILSSLPAVYQWVTGSRFEFWGFGQVKFASLYGKHYGYRAAGPIGDPNFYAMILVCSLPLSATVLLQKGAGHWRRLLAAIAMAASLGAIVASYSRASLIGIAFVGVLLAMVHSRRAAIATAAGVLAVVLFTAMPKEYMLRMLTLRDVSVATQQRNIADPSYRGRHSEMMVGIEMFKRHPLLGIGPGNYVQEYQKYNAIVGLDERTEARDAHDWFLQIAAEQGVLGLAALAYLIWTVLVETGRVAQRLQRQGARNFAQLTWAIELAIGSYLIMSVFLHSAFFRHFMLLIAFAAAACTVAGLKLRRLQRPVEHAATRAA